MRVKAKALLRYYYGAIKAWGGRQAAVLATIYVGESAGSGGGGGGGAELELAALTDARLLRSIQLPNHKLKVGFSLVRAATCFSLKVRFSLARAVTCFIELLECTCDGESRAIKALLRHY